MTVFADNAAGVPVHSMVKVFPVLALHAALVTAVCGNSAKYGCALALCCQVLMHPRAALCAAPADLVLGDDMIAGAPCAAPPVLLCSDVGST